MSCSAGEDPTPIIVDLVTITVETTRDHAVRVVESVVEAMSNLAGNLVQIQGDQIAVGNAGGARYTNHQVGRALAALVEAQELNKTLTTQGEAEVGNNV